MDTEIELPEGSEIACPGLSIDVTLRFENVPEAALLNKLVAILSNDDFYFGINRKLLEFTESQIRVHFFKPPWRKIAIRCPTPYESYEESPPTEAELKRLVMMGLSLEIYIQDENYDHLYHLVDSDDFCDECQKIVQTGMETELEKLNLIDAEVFAEVVECGGG